MYIRYFDSKSFNVTWIYVIFSAYNTKSFETKITFLIVQLLTGTSTQYAVPSPSPQEKRSDISIIEIRYGAYSINKSYFVWREIKFKVSIEKVIRV